MGLLRRIYGTEWCRQVVDRPSHPGAKPRSSVRAKMRHSRASPGLHMEVPSWMSVTNHLAFPPSIRIPLVLHVFVSWHRAWLLAASLPVTIAATSALPTASAAPRRPIPAPEIENAKHSFEGVVIDNTYVRSGPKRHLLPDPEDRKGRDRCRDGKEGELAEDPAARRKLFIGAESIRQ